jgi:hypothetical protein
MNRATLRRIQVAGDVKNYAQLPNLSRGRRRTDICSLFKIDFDTVGHVSFAHSDRVAPTFLASNAV